MALDSCAALFCPASTSVDVYADCSDTPLAFLPAPVAQLCAALTPYYNAEKFLASAALPVLREVLGNRLGYALQPCFYASRSGANDDPRDDGAVSHFIPVGGSIGDISMISVRVEFKVCCQAGQTATGRLGQIYAYSTVTPCMHLQLAPRPFACKLPAVADAMYL